MWYFYYLLYIQQTKAINEYNNILNKELLSCEDVVISLPISVNVDSNLLKEMMNLNSIGEEVKNLLSKIIK